VISCLGWLVNGVRSFFFEGHYVCVAGKLTFNGAPTRAVFGMGLVLVNQAREEYSVELKANQPR
jgi:hypothetical protein